MSTMEAAPSRAEVGIAVGANPFSRLAVLVIVLLGTALFVALLYMIGTGIGLGSTNDGQAHADGRGLNGYAALAGYLEGRGYDVTRARSDGRLDKPGLLILTPPASAKGKDIDRIVTARRYIGPTIVIVPKWQAERPSGQGQDRGPSGWVRLIGTELPNWPGFLDDISVSLDRAAPGQDGLTWVGADLSGALPEPKWVLSGAGTGLVRLVATRDEDRTLAGFMDDGGSYPGLEAMTRERVLHPGEEDGLYPLVLIFEPDLVDNYGMGRFQNARLAEALVRASGVRTGDPVVFDLTLNGFGRAQNLLTLAFTPPFLAATLCLILAAVIVGWRAFLRFGPPFAATRAIAFGKSALVSNAGGMIVRSGRLHLIAGPYADRSRERLVAALALPRTLDPEQAGQAIDRALARRDPAAEPFTNVAARLRAARRVPDLLKAARDLHALERMLIR